MGISSILSLMRPRHYIKNGFIFLPLFFGGKIADTALLFNAFVAFCAFSIAASGIYVLNDYRDIEDDRRHPRKKNRPLASGEIESRHALIISPILLLTGLALMSTVSLYATVMLATYVLMNIAYSFVLKRIAIVDVTVISIGFVLRIFVGSAVTGVPLSMWIVIMTFLLAMFMALSKRRDDVLVYLDTGEKMRQSVDGYNLRFLDAAMVIMASVVIVAYLIYTTSADVIDRVQSEYLYLTVFFAIIGIMRYLQIVFVDKDSASPTRIILRDGFMQVTVLGWIAAFTWMLY